MIGQGLVKFYSSDQSGFVGCGFLFSSRYVLTCAHVLEAVSAELQDGQRYNVLMPFQKETAIELVLLKAFPRIEDAVFYDWEDIAILEIDAKHSTQQDLDIIPNQSMGAAEQKQQDFEVYSTRQNSYVNGSSPGPSEQGWVILNSDLSVEPGDSGSPVWNKQVKAVTGLLVARKRGSFTSYIIPTEKFYQAFQSWLVPQQRTADAKGFLERDKRFMEDMKVRLIEDVSKSEKLKQHLFKYLDLPHDQHNSPGDYLINSCFEHTVQCIHAALVKVLDKLVATDDAIERDCAMIAAESLVTRLCLFNLDESWLKQSAQQLSCDHQFYTLPEMTDLGVTVLTARQARMKPNLEFEKGTVVGKDMTLLESGFECNQVIDNVLKSIFKRIFPKKPWNDGEDRETIKRKISKAIQQRRKHPHDDFRRHYPLVLRLQKNSPLSDNRIKAFVSSIPGLFCIEFQSATDQEVFLLDDERMALVVEHFYETLKGYKAS